jgi:predicted permease
LTLIASAACGVVFGLSPALRTARPDLVETLKHGGRGSSGTRHRAQNVFVVAQTALSVVLLIGAGMMIRGIAGLRKTDLGFNPSNVLKFDLSFSSYKSRNPDAIRLVIRNLSAKLESVPGVDSASAYAGALPMDGDSEVSFWIKGHPKPTALSEMDVAMWHAVQPDYLKVMGIPLLRGRFFSSQDDEHSPYVVTVDDRFARRYFPNEDPLGKRIHAEQMNVDAEIVGVVGHVEQWGPEDASHENRQAQFYFPMVQLPDEILRLFSQLGIVARTLGPPKMLIASIRAASSQVDADQAVSEFSTMDQIVSRSIGSQQLTMNLLGVFALLALALSALGVYGVISYAVSQRTHEIGVRLALGAQRKDILQLILADGMTVVLVGVGIGIGAAIVLARFMTKMVYGVGVASPATFAAVAAILVFVALTACYLPARRALRIDAMILVREE